MSNNKTEMIATADDPFTFFLFGMDRLHGVVPNWEMMKYDKGPVLHLGPGKKGQQSGTIDCEYPDFDFDDVSCLQFPRNGKRGYGDGTVSGVVATHVLEHLHDPRVLIWEVARVLRRGGNFNIVVPKAGSNLWHQDLDHKSGFVLDTWKTLLDSSYYTKGKKTDHGLVVGFNAEMSIKEGNNVIVTQLLKVT